MLRLTCVPRLWLPTLSAQTRSLPRQQCCPGIVPMMLWANILSLQMGYWRWLVISEVLINIGSSLHCLSLAAPRQTLRVKIIQIHREWFMGKWCQRMGDAASSTDREVVVAWGAALNEADNSKESADGRNWGTQAST